MRRFYSVLRMRTRSKNATDRRSNITTVTRPGDRVRNTTILSILAYGSYQMTRLCLSQFLFTNEQSNALKLAHFCSLCQFDSDFLRHLAIAKSIEKIQ